MSEIRYIDRMTKQEEVEQVYGGEAIKLFYGTGWLSKLMSFFVLPLVARIHWASRLYGLLQKSCCSRRKVLPFIAHFRVDAAEFLDPPESYASFNEFFIRKLKASCRPIAPGNDVAVLPADGRYLVYANIDKADGFWVKGQKFSITELLQDAPLAHKYSQGALVMARLCPVDYHRFHFPCNCTPDAAQLINGPLFSVNPLALKRNIAILAENKRVVTQLHTKNFGTVLYIEVGATAVGSIHQTFVAEEHYAKGDEKGYFSFGGSCLLLLFEPFRIQFDQDLLDATHRRLEMRGRFGQTLGRALNPF